MPAFCSGDAMNLFDLSGRVAVVTGGNGGIGLGMAEGIAAAGAMVVLGGRNATKGAAAVRRIKDAGGKSEFADVDVTSEKSCRALIEGVASRHGSTFWSTMPGPTSARRRTF
jgi:2-deoxy-D-gluconate 3-dehydrogenase